MKQLFWGDFYFSNYSKALLFLFGLAICSCGKNSSEISATFTRVQDFGHSTITDNGPIAADGQAELSMVIHLINSDNTPVTSFLPTYVVTVGADVTAAACTVSNSSGASTCKLKATVAGTKTVSVTNIIRTLTADVVFSNPSSTQSLGLASAGNTQTQAGYTLSANVGNQEPGLVKTNGNYKLLTKRRQRHFGSAYALFPTDRRIICLLGI